MKFSTFVLILLNIVAIVLTQGFWLIPLIVWAIFTKMK